jgi:hypothetical protein
MDLLLDLFSFFKNCKTSNLFSKISKSLFSHLDKSLSSSSYKYFWTDLSATESLLIAGYFPLSLEPRNIAHMEIYLSFDKVSF